MGSLSRVAHGVSHFYLAPQRGYSMELLRVSLGVFCVVYGFLLFPERHIWFGNYGVVFPPLVSAWAPGALQLSSIFAGSSWVTGAFVLFIFASFLFAAGILVRPMIWLSFLSLLALQNRDLQAMYGGDVLLKQFLFYLAVAPAWSAAGGLSLPTSLMQRPFEACAPTRPMYAQRLFQIQISLIYLSTALWKLQGTTWWDGTALYYSMHHHLYQLFGVEFLTEHLWLSKLFTWLGLLLELLLGVAIWIPSLRLPMIGLGFVVHMTLWVLINVPFWQPIMMIGLIAFIEERDWQTLGTFGFRGLAWRNSLKSTCPAQGLS